MNINNYMNRVVVLILILFFSSCSCTLPERTINIVPIVVDKTDDDFLFEINILELTNEILKKDLNISIRYKEIHYSNKLPRFSTCSMFEGLILTYYPFDEYIQQDTQAIVLMQQIKMTTNILGCAEQNGIPQRSLLDGQARMWMNLGIDPYEDACTLAHEIAHLLGAEHTDDNSIMSPTKDGTHCVFSKESKREINRSLNKVGL